MVSSSIKRAAVISSIIVLVIAGITMVIIGGICTDRYIKTEINNAYDYYNKMHNEEIVKHKYKINNDHQFCENIYYGELIMLSIGCAIVLSCITFVISMRKLRWTLRTMFIMVITIVTLMYGCLLIGYGAICDKLDKYSDLTGYIVDGSCNKSSLTDLLYIIGISFGIIPFVVAFLPEIYFDDNVE